MQQARWQRQAYELGLGEYGFTRLLAMWDLYRMALTDIADREGETSPNLLPPLYGPYFAYIGRDLMPAFAYVMPAIFSIVLVSLDNIQDHLENPFDQLGEDDVRINVEKFIDRLENIT